MKRVFFARANQIIIIPAVGVLWSEKGVLLSVAWLNFGCSILLFRKR